jgi:hypothetical protein
MSMVTNKLRDNTRKFSRSLLLLALLVVASSGAQAQSESTNGARSAAPNAAPPHQFGVVAKVARSLRTTQFVEPDARLAGSPVSPKRAGLAIAPETAAVAAGRGSGVHAVISGSLGSKFAGLRDPFRLPPPPAAGAAGMELRRAPLPGKRGLVIGQLRLLGIVRQHAPDSADARSTMIAVVTNASNVAYFLHAGDVLYDGRITGITADAAHFELEYLDPEGQVKRREVVKRLNAVSGEEQ